MADFRERLKKGVVLFDGAAGTLFQQQGLEPGKPPEILQVENYDLVVRTHAKYAEAGAEIITTNSFGGNEIKLAECGLEGHFEEINRKAVRAARAAGDVFVAGDIGPTGKFIEPVGDLSWKRAVEIFARQARILDEEGADLFVIETMSDIKEIKAAVAGIRSVSGLPVVAMMTFEEGGRTTLGTPPEAAAVVLDALGVDVIGSNCSVGPEGIYRWLRVMRKVTAGGLVAQPNAGLPRIEDGKTVFPLGPEGMAEWVEKFLDLGCIAVGSCCGSTPEHTRAIASELDRLGREWRKPEDPLPGVTRLASRTKIALVGRGRPVAAIGERINPTGKSGFSETLKRGDLAGVRDEARLQEAGGVDLLDINVGVPGVDEAELLGRAVSAVEASSSLPLVLDSSDPKAIEAGLIACSGKPLINSVRGEKKSLKKILPLARKYGAAVLGLCTDEKGVPRSAKDRTRVGRRIVKAALKAGIPDEDILLDPVTVPAGTDGKQPLEALKAVRYFRDRMGINTLQGVSNVSFGLPRRGALNAAYLAMAVGAGLNATFVNPLDLPSMEILYASRVLADQDPAAKRYVDFVSGKGGTGGGETRRESVREEGTTWRERLRAAVINGDSDRTAEIVNEALAEGTPPMRVGEEVMIPAIAEVGRRYEAGEIFLPNLILSAEAMQAGMELINRALEEKSEAVKPRGTVVLATVEGDIHDIGKNIVSTVLRSNGWKVIDLGRSVKGKDILREAETSGADVVGLSALMTTTVVKMPGIIEMLHRKNIPVMVGGAVLTEEYSLEIGADFYGKDAMAALRGAQKLKGAR